MGYIYRIINKVTQQTYIGQTTQDLYERWRQHKKSQSNCRYLKSALNKYGVDNFEFKLICIGFDDKLNDLEIYYINKYNSAVPNGYNLKLGGNNGGKHNEETKKKISETLKKTLSITKRESKLGRPHTEETKTKLSKALTGIKQKQETIKKRSKLLIKHRVFKIDKETKNILEIFNGYTEAAKNVGTSKNAIWKVCNGKGNTANGFIWKSELI